MHLFYNIIEHPLKDNTCIMKQMGGRFKSSDVSIFKLHNFNQQYESVLFYLQKLININGAFKEHDINLDYLQICIKLLCIFSKEALKLLQSFSIKQFTKTIRLSNHKFVQLLIYNNIRISFILALEIQQMNQRASHFSLGNTSQPFGSVYAKDYGPKAAENNQIKANNPFRGSSINHGEAASFATTNKTLLKAWDHVEKAKLEDQKLKQLKNHHFKLGSYAPGNALTTNKIYHNHKQIDGEASKNQQESKNKMRTHNHDFKEQGFTNYRSSYTNQFNYKEAQTTGKAGGQQVGNAICFGNNLLPMVTTNNASFTPKEVQQNRVKPQPTMGITLGGKGEPMETINQLYYTQKEITKAALPQATIKQLRSTHFQLGQMVPKYVTQNHHNYRGTFSQAKQSKDKIPVYQSGTWVDKQGKFNPVTTYQRQLTQREVKPFQRAVQATRSGMDLGGHASNYQSEFKSNFVTPQNPTYNRLQVNKKSSVVIGSQNTKAYETQHKSSYKVNNLQQAKVNIDIKKLSREDHFSIGGTTAMPKGTVYQDQHRQDVQNRSKVFHKQNK